MHSYSLSLRQTLRGRVEVTELVPPAVRTGITPGQQDNAAFLPLGDFADEAITILNQDPTPGEVLVDRVKFQRFAEAENRFDASMIAMNEMAAQPQRARS